MSSLRVPLVIATVVALVTLGGLIQPLPDPVVSPPSVDLDQPLIEPSSADLELNQQVVRARFFETSVLPLIEQLEADNRAAANRCLIRTERLIDQYHRGVEPFVQDMTSISTRLGILKRMPAGWWKEDGRVESYVQQKFESHLFSEQSLVRDITSVLMQFRSEVDANQRATLADVQAALTTADLPAVRLDQQEAFFRKLSQQINQYAADQGTTSVQNMIGAFVLGEVGAFAARSVIAGLLSRFAPTVALSAAAGTSATVGASATGAGGGSLAGPVGTVVGFGAGLAVGLVIDWWMTERFEAELREQMHGYLDALHATLIDGGNARTSSAGQSDPAADRPAAGSGVGLSVALPRLCDQLSQAYRDRFFIQIVQGESS
ncbi:hypothetical protein FYK55_09590 [Roseiconus nitratireducens]|uniref:Uncharacterized protein n=1 Tax=Roseiconus nitratireducens TaxID=2605748 RepID=A0A5M6DAJ7_9BACT|nr:hypothetical protein [Roseiconus nitratireducens]KAA5544561.1 hypothetical protein FYK55_09590 [Roseiconus nitratireducens]